MKLADQLCSVFFARQLRKMKVMDESVFHWNSKLEMILTGIDFHPFKNGKCDGCICLYSEAELSRMLLDQISDGEFIIQRNEYKWKWQINHTSFGKGFISHHDDKLADAMAGMLISLIEKSRSKA